jgi:sugar phosphate isomerase/epimerase
MQWGFSTLGCPELNIEQCIDLAARFEVPFIELRGFENRLDTPAYLVERFPDMADLKSKLTQAGVRIVSVDASFKLTEGGEEDREELRDYAVCATQLKVPFVRTFGGGSMAAPLTDEELHTASAHYTWWLREKERNGWTCDLMLETHDGFCDSERCLQLQRALPEPMALLWDTHHTWKIGGEDLDATWNRIGSWVKQVHIKDSHSIPSARHPYSYVLPGEGEFDLSSTIQLLESKNFDGVVCLEWERKWHPYLPPLGEALTRARDLQWW